MTGSESRQARFEDLFREHHRAVQAYARRRVPQEVVDDIVSETFLVLWRRLDEAPEALLPWLLTVARNVIGTERRRAARRQRLWLKAQSGYAGDHDPGEPAIADERVLGALARLSERDREALTLVAWDGLTATQAATVLDGPPERFRQRLHRAKSRLRIQLADEFRGDDLASPFHEHTPVRGSA